MRKDIPARARENPWFRGPTPSQQALIDDEYENGMERYEYFVPVHEVVAAFAFALAAAKIGARLSLLRLEKERDTGDGFDMAPELVHYSELEVVYYDPAKSVAVLSDNHGLTFTTRTDSIVRLFPTFVPIKTKPDRDSEEARMALAQIESELERQEARLDALGA